MSFGYIGDTSTSVKQQVKNKGILTTQESFDLERQGFLGGTLELIQSQTISSGSTMSFTSIKETEYDVHLLQAKNCESSSANTSISVRLSNDGGSSYEAGTNYQIALEYISTNGSRGEVGSTGTSYMEFLSDTANENRSGYMYLFNLGSSSKFSYSTFQQMMTGTMTFGGSVYDTAETINAIQVLTTNTNAWTGTIELFGIKQI